MVAEVDQIEGQEVSEEAEEPMELTQEQIDALKNKNVMTVTVNIPVGLHMKLEEMAEAEDTSITNFARQVLANTAGYDLPPQGRGRQKKYATDAERAAAQKKQQDTRRKQIAALQAKLKAGEINLD